MRYALVVLLVSLLTFIATARADEAITWTGTVELPGGMKLEFSVDLKKDSGTISIPMQGAKDLPLSDVAVSDKELKFSIKQAGAVWDMKVADDGQSATGVLKQGGEFKTTMKRLGAGESASKELKRPQEPKPPFPYETIEVFFENKPANVTLAGTLSVPKGDGPFPCAVMITGSGAQDRDEALMGHKPFLIIADYLTRRGVAVLRYDDRGVAKSTGSFAAATSDDFAEDALAGVEFLKTRKEVDSKRIGLIGHSEGGLIAPICAAKSSGVSFIVLLAGTGIPGAELLGIQSRLIGLASGMDEATVDRLTSDAAKIYGMITAGKSEEEVRAAIRDAATLQLKASPEGKGLTDEEVAKKAEELAVSESKSLLSPWFKRFLKMDPRENLKKVKCPVLAVNGEKDLQVPPKENLGEIEKALKAGGNTDVTVLEFPGLNHLFQTCETGAPNEYGEIEETFAPVALETVAAWIRRRTGLDRP